MLKVALVGHGFLGKWHGEKIHHNPDVEFTAIVEANKSSHEELKKKYPQTKVVDDIKELENLDVDAAIIATPTSFHFELTKNLLEKGIHVFCEKPLCATQEEAEQLKSFLNPNVVLQVGHSERYHPIWEEVKKDLAQMTGPYIIKIDRIAPFKGRATDVDVVQDLMIHDLDLIQFLFPKNEAVEVKARGFKQRTNHADYALAELLLADQSKAFLTVGRNYVLEKRHFEVTGKEGTLFVDLMRGEYFKALASEDSVSKVNYQKADHLDLEQKAFFDVIKGKRTNPVDYEQGLGAVVLVERVRNEL